jgi:hypothetical protein
MVAGLRFDFPRTSRLIAWRGRWPWRRFLLRRAFGVMGAAAGMTSFTFALRLAAAAA